MVVFLDLGAEYFWKSFQQNERIVTSPWLPIVWPFKFMIPATAVLLLLQGIAECIRAWARAFGPGEPIEVQFLPPPPDDGDGSVVL